MTITTAATVITARNRQNNLQMYCRPLHQSTATSGKSRATGANTTSGLADTANPTLPSIRKWRAWVKSQKGHGQSVSILRGQNKEISAPTPYDKATQAKPAAYTADTDR